MVDAGEVGASLATVDDPVFLLEGLFAGAPVAIAIAGADGRCLAVNREFRELFGAAPPPGHDLFRDERIAAHGALPHVERALAGERVSAPAFWYDAGPRDPPGAGRRLALELAVLPLPDRGGAVRQVALCFKDVTAAHELGERRQRELERERVRQLEDQNLRIHEANRLKSEFLAAMSHELRTPLNAIIGFSELLFYGRVAPSSPEHHEFVGEILTSGRHLLQLIDDVLDLARIEAGKLELRPEPIEIAPAIAEVASVLQTLSLEKRIRVEVEADRSLPAVVLDPARFKQVLYNYLSNALKFTPEGGHVVVRTSPETPESFRLEVEDTGIGIAPDQLARLFLAFEQIDARAGNPPGTGLGLALTRKIVEAQGGTVGVRSRPGHGSIFHAVLPRQTAAIRAR